jgi:hypothetical protein
MSLIKKKALEKAMKMEKDGRHLEVDGFLRDKGLDVAEIKQRRRVMEGKRRRGEL